MIFAFILYPLGGKVTAAVAGMISILVIISELQELGFQNNLIRMMVPKGSSQNVLLARMTMPVRWVWS